CRWRRADQAARTAVDGLIDSWSVPFEGRIARDVVALAPAGAALVVASSMPVRDVESFAAPREGVTFHANRGVNGIDGFVSTVLGVASGASSPTVALVGDLCFLHDANGLLGAVGRGLDVTFVVVDNDGGGIFSVPPPSGGARLPAPLRHPPGRGPGRPAPAPRPPHGGAVAPRRRRSRARRSAERRWGAGGARAHRPRRQRRPAPQGVGGRGCGVG